MYEINQITANSLPYIKIKIYNETYKLLIDTGCSFSIIRPYIIEKYHPECIFFDKTELKTCTGKATAEYKALVPPFAEFNTDKDIEFILYDFHEYFDGLIGFRDLQKLNLSIDIENNRLKNRKTSIPYYFRDDFSSYKFDLNPLEIITKKVPVNISEGEILIHPYNKNGIYIPEILTFARGGLAKIEIHNHLNRHNIITFHGPYSCTPVNNQVEIYNCNLLPPDTDKIDIRSLIRTEHLNGEEKEAIIELCQEYNDVLQKPKQPLSFTNIIKHHIRTKDEEPCHSKIYRYPKIHKEEITRQIQQMLEEGIIRPSISPWSSPVWIVPKKLDSSGKRKWRIVIDYRKVNEKTIDDRYPIPNINDILDRFGRCRYFTTLDLASGFHQIEMHPDSIEKTAFNTDSGHYEFLRMPFGLKNAPATFQRVMDNVLRHLLNKICLVYMDDVIVFSTSLTEHINNLKQVFQTLRTANLKVQLDKSEFLRKEVEFLGHIVTPEGIRPNSKKIDAIRRFPIPKTQREIKSFLGLIGYYRKFIKNFAKIVKPLTQRLKKGEKIIIDDNYKHTFEYCKTLLSNEPILAYPDFSKEFQLTTDSSNFALGAVLSQDGHPICYASRTLNPAEQNYSTIEKELLAIVWACKYFRPYLYGQKFTAFSDHKPLEWLFSLKTPNARLHRWRLELEEFDFNVKYKKGKENQAADALSRVILENSVELNAIDDDKQSMIVNTGDEDIYQEILDLADNVIKIQTQQEFKDPEKASSAKQANDNLGPDLFTSPPATPNIPQILQETSNDENDNDDLATQHTSRENPILDIPFTERPINSYKNQIIIPHSPNCLMSSISTSKIFDNIRHTLTLTKFADEKEITKQFKQLIAPSRSYCLFFYDENDKSKIITTLQQNFISLKLIISTKFLQDVTDKDEQQNLIKYHHEGKVAHKGIHQVKKSLKNYYWPSMEADIRLYINTCETCQTCKYERHPQNIKLQITPTPKRPLETIHIDTFHCENKTFLTILDPFSKFGQALPLKDKNSIQIYDSLLTFVSFYGLPQRIVSDNGTEFKNHLLVDFCNLHKITLHFTTPGNSNSNSPVERFHSTLLDDLRCLRKENPQKNIETLIKFAVISYNNSVHSVTQQTPFNILLGHTNVIPFDLSEKCITSEYVQNHKSLADKIYEKIRHSIDKNKDKVISKENETRSEPETVQTDQDVYIKTNQGRAKTRPKFIKARAVKDKDITLQTKKGLVHKNRIKRKRIIPGTPVKTRNKNSKDEESTTASTTQPSTSRS